MTCHVDQSNKIEQTQKDTVIAFSNGVKFTLLIGKKSPAHRLVGKVSAGKQNPDLRVTAKEAMEILWPKKKTGHPEGSRSV